MEENTNVPVQEETPVAFPVTPATEVAPVEPTPIEDATEATV